MTDPDVSPTGDAARVAACVVPPAASPAVLDHAVDRRVDFIIVVDSAALASPDNLAEAQEALSEDPGLDDLPDEEAASGATAEALKPLAGELELDDAEAAEFEPSTIAATLDVMARRRPTLLNLGPSDCRYAVDTITRVDPFGRRRTLHLFCSDSQAPDPHIAPSTQLCAGSPFSAARFAIWSDFEDSRRRESGE